MVRKFGTKYDWDALKIEWLKTDISLNQFREEKGIDVAHFYRSIDKNAWESAKQAIYEKALKKIQEKASTAIANKWADYDKLWGAVKMQAAAILKKTQQKDGTIRPLEPHALRNLTESIDTALKSERLLADKSTENIAAVDVHGYILKKMTDEHNENS